ncbi:lipopolysaccharide biosynthesis protein [Streptomyces sp. bgisy022]|uniref:lipopolysaccharide biosynthesis protein n=1 Tax=Streptomyces sp. bgisy022 TaxID=3413769 RepID=UPI003D725FBD
MAETRVHEPSAAHRGGSRPGPRPGSAGGSDSLFKNAYFLMLSTGVSAVLGLGFWLVAARYYSEDAVGQGSAAIAAMRLLAGITATTMIGAVVRFVPRAGRETARLVWGVYGASSLVVALAAGVFLLTLDQWGASYAPLGTLSAGALFVAACVAWALLTLQDGVLTGLRRAEWVPAGNAVFSVGKLALLAVFAGAMPVLGIFVSWAVAIAFSTLPLGWLIFRRLIPRQAAADQDVEPPRLRSVGRFLAGDSLGALFSLAMINLLPVMVAVRFSAAENGYFYIAYTVGGTMEFMAINMASSLTAHASHDPRRLADGVRGALRRMGLLLVPVVLVLVVCAEQILTPFSPDYAEHGSTVLRLLALGALPRVVVELYIGVLRVQGRTGVLAALQGAMCVLVLGSAAVLFTPAGISGAGWAVLGSMSLIAVVSVFGLRSALRPGPAAPADPPPAEPVYGTRWARLNATAGYGTSWARRAAYEGGDPDGGGVAGCGRKGGSEDTVSLFIGTPGYEREAFRVDPPTVAVRRQQPPRPGGGTSGAGGPQAVTGETAPSDARPGDLSPAHASPAEASPADAVPTDAVPVDAVGAEGVPADAVPAAAELADGAPAEGAPAGVPGSAPASPGPRGSGPAGLGGPAGTEVDGREDEVRDRVGTEGAGEMVRGGAEGAGEAVLGDASDPPGPSVPPVRSAPPGGLASWEREAPAEASSAPRDEAPPAAPLPTSAAPSPSVPALVPGAGTGPGSGPAPVDPDRFLRRALWGGLGLATFVFWWSVRPLAWLRGPSRDDLTGQDLLHELPLPALAAGGVLLLVFVASVTLCLRPAPRSAGAALGSALLALHAAPIALGREPRPAEGPLYEEAAGLVADAVGLDGTGPLLRWAPVVCTLLCLVPLWLLLGCAGGRLSWERRWGVLYLVAVGGWVWQGALASVAPVLLVVLVLLVPVVRAVAASALPGHALRLLRPLRPLRPLHRDVTRGDPPAPGRPPRPPGSPEPPGPSAPPGPSRTPED